MENKDLFIISLIVVIIGLVFMGISRLISPFPEIVTRVIVSVIFIDLFVLSYSGVRLKGKNN